MKRLLLTMTIALSLSGLAASAETSRGDPSSHAAKAGHHNLKAGKRHAKAGKHSTRRATAKRRDTAKIRQASNIRGRGVTGQRRAGVNPAARARVAKGGAYAVRRASLLPTVRAATPRHIPVNLVDAIISKESRYNVNARGSRGEIGLMQILPSTARRIARKIGQGSVASLSDAELRSYLSVPRNNLKFGLDYLSTCHKMAKGNIAATVGCYNAGPANMWRWGQIKITRAYVDFVRIHMANAS